MGVFGEGKRLNYRVGMKGAVIKMTHESKREGITESPKTIDVTPGLHFSSSLSSEVSDIHIAFQLQLSSFSVSELIYSQGNPFSASI